MQKLTTIELCWIICELENIASDSMEIGFKCENRFDREYFKIRADNLYAAAEKLRLALNNEDKRIAIE